MTIPLQLPSIRQTTALMIGRWLLAAMFIESIVNHLRHYTAMVEVVRAQGMPLADALLPLSLLVEVFGVFGLTTGKALKFASIGLIGFVAVSTLLFFPFWALEGEPSAAALQNFVKNLALLGFLLVIYASASEQPDNCDSTDTSC